MKVQELEPWLRLIRAPGIGPAAARKLLDAFGDAGSACKANGSQLRDAGLSAAQAQALREVTDAALSADLAWLAADGHALIPYTDARYPAALRDIPQAPVALFCKGKVALLTEPQVAIVGARSASPQGLENAKAFASELSRRGLVITSGLALGIDGAAHRGALEGGGATIAVCATGLDRVYPARHQALAREIAARGLLVSEFPVGVEALAENFPRRNRIIAGLALGTLVVEAALESGSLITARYASEQGREVFAIPGSIHNPMARGCHRLLRNGAKLTETADDVLAELAPQLRASLASAEPRTTAPHPELLAALGDTPQSADDLATRCPMDIGSLSAALLELELGGWVSTTGDGRYMKVRG